MYFQFGDRDQVEASPNKIIWVSLVRNLDVPSNDRFSSSIAFCFYKDLLWDKETGASEFF